MLTTQHGAVTSIVFDDIFAGWEQWLLLTSDQHWDSVYCNRDLMIEHLEEAKRRKALVFCFGDFYDAMQGKFDPRRDMSELRPEFRVNNYYDVVVTEAAKWLKPYAGLFAVMSDGNHELSILKNSQTNLMDRLVHDLNSANGTDIKHGGYGGWVRFMFQCESVPQTSIRLKYFHGSGGEAPVTRGAIQTARQAVYLPDANIVVNGHSHNNYYIPISRERLSNKGVQYLDLQHHVRTPGYKQGYGDGSSGWEVTRGGVPKPIGAVWVRLFARTTPSAYSVDVQVIADIRGADPIEPVSMMGEGIVYGQDAADDL